MIGDYPQNPKKDVKTLRLDKFISEQTPHTRSDVKRFVKRGEVLLNGAPAKTADQKVNPDTDRVSVLGKEIIYEKFVYIMLNKPKGVVSATTDRDLPTVVDLVASEMSHRALFPAGRLDRDTEGFVLLTDDGDFAHRILSPKNHVAKTYIATLSDPAPENAEECFEKGVVLGDETVCLSAHLTPLNKERTECEVVLGEGMYHQIKRMFASLGTHVVELKRVKMGNLPLDPSLKSGQWRKLTPDEVGLIESGKM